ncbi:hypothetical protein PMZ80_011272 [Knufia obscura]|uniref:Uncharacterized protein n=1 Tax=Knufia obscura TaxID=1635080 RepID=A0ABR0R785_9EURO|nr:hypothetical protein PMZ80_011272 [Knufia obscura]
MAVDASVPPSLDLELRMARFVDVVDGWGPAGIDGSASTVDLLAVDRYAPRSAGPGNHAGIVLATRATMVLRALSPISPGAGIRHAMGGLGPCAPYHYPRSLFHMLWLNTAAEGAAAHTLLNRTLAQDTTGDSDFFNISVYRRQERTELQLGRRVTSHAGVADWQAIIADEVAWSPQDIEHRAQVSSLDQLPLLNPSAFAIDQCQTIVMVSATANIRRLVHQACRPHVSPRVRLVELEFQPEDDLSDDETPAADPPS